ncbi:hypothetical protein SAMN04489835_2273 [Mycolicibacterium rutilum]|uniref:PASTA domain-containing protein n=1 Tax=Mycolicibacterium rutilum TaxID=370526 RepID=A0A1H6JW53_MYCRU|nr:hypothetical protein [Mycolicibacterium rutilum]SEH63313.1 hypothetical protein SAMN04489835_2273 [Mycolicibacterium rutilum]
MRLQMLGIGAVAAAASAMVLFGSATAAAAPDVVGQPYSDAVDAIEQGGGTAVVAARVGDKLDQGDCVVVNAWDSSFLRISESRSQVSLALNCAGEYATATNPGASVASPLGREAKSKAEEEAAEEEQQALEEVSTPDE